MKRQKSFINERPTLYLVATPIGNLNELTPRAIEILKDVDVIAAEDTRNSKKLLQHFDIHTKLVAHHNFNEKQSSEGLLQLLNQGKNIALISDAGYPLIQDPGQGICQQC
ncbi:MAG: SAM-dependent methyltransferase, partial [Erysipelotrichaceae bacterium]